MAQSRRSTMMLCFAAKRKLHHKLKERYREKLKRLSESHERHYSLMWHWEHNRRFTCNGRSTHNGDRCHFKACRLDYKDSNGNRKAPPEDGNFNKNCHLHGVDSKHSYNKCRQNPKNQACANNNNYYYVKKCAHNVHYHDSHHNGRHNEPLVSCTSLALSDGDLSANKSSGNCSLENHHLDSFHIPPKRKVGNVGHKSPENNALVKARVSPDLNAIFDDDVTVNSFLKAFQDDPGLSICNTNDAFKFKN
jgi:hypothetical protein